MRARRLSAAGKLPPHRVEAGIDPVLDRPLATAHAITVRLVPIAPAILDDTHLAAMKANRGG
jgi:hypothetical protein